MQDHAADAGAGHAPHVADAATMEAESARRPPVLVVALLSFVALAAGLATASLFGPK